MFMIQNFFNQFYISTAVTKFIFTALACFQLSWFFFIRSEKTSKKHSFFFSILNCCHSCFYAYTWNGWRIIENRLNLQHFKNDIRNSDALTFSNLYSSVVCQIVARNDDLLAVEIALAIGVEVTNPYNLKKWKYDNVFILISLLLSSNTHLITKIMRNSDRQK